MYIYVWTSTHMCCTHGALSFFRANFSMDCFWGHALWFTIVYLFLIYLFIHFLIMFPLQFAGYIRVDVYAIIVFLNHFSFSTSSHWAVRFFSTFSRPGVNRWNKKYNNSRFSFLCLFVFLTGSCWFPDLISLERVFSRPWIDWRIDVWRCPAGLYVYIYACAKTCFVFISVTFHWIEKSWNKTKTKVPKKRICYYYFSSLQKKEEGGKERKRDDIDEPNQIPGFTWIMSIESGAGGVEFSKVK